MMPNFLIIGAARSGTTSLYHYLGSHPEIFMSPVKEPNFFAYDGMSWDFGYEARARGTRIRLSISDPEKYRSLFRSVKGEKAIGEASSSYMVSPGASARIHEAIPGGRLIAILRHPADRAFANWTGNLRDGTEPSRDPFDAIGGTLQGRGPRWRSVAYIDTGFYCERLRPFYERFGPDRIRICLFDDFARDPLAVLRDLFSFLDVDPAFEPDTSVIHNSSGRIANPLLRHLWTSSTRLRARLRPWLPGPIKVAGWHLVQRNLSRPPFPPDLRAALIERYRPDILELEKLIDRDLSDWLV